MEEQYSTSLAVYYAGREKCQSGHSFGPAVRSHYLMHVVLDGQGTYEAGGERFCLKRGDAFLIYPNEMTVYRADEEEPWEYAWVAFGGYEVKKILSQTGFSERGLVFSTEDTELFLKRIIKLSDTFNKHQSHELELTGQFYQLMALLVKEWEGENASYEKRYFDKAFNYIWHNYGYPLKISDIANHVGIDRTYLYKIFMNIEKCSPKQFLLRFRIDAAQNMLRTMKYSVTQTAYSCGFKDAAAFCSHFKKIAGLTPKQYRDKMKRDIPD